MNRLIERRQSDRSAEEALSPEYLRVLEVCGGEIRQGDRAALAGHAATGAFERRKVDGTAADRAGPAGPVPQPPGFTS
jgi:hypothetical protein